MLRDDLHVLIYKVVWSWAIVPFLLLGIIYNSPLTHAVWTYNESFFAHEEGPVVKILTGIAPFYLAYVAGKLGGKL